MAAKKASPVKAVPASEPETDDSDSAAGIENKEPGDLHIAFADWVQAEYGEDVDPRAIQLAWGVRNKWRKTDGYAEQFGKEARAARRQALEAEKEKKRAEKAAEAAAAEAEQEAKPATKATRKPRTTSAEALAEAEAENPKASVGRGAKKGRTAAF